MHKHAGRHARLPPLPWLSPSLQSSRRSGNWKSRRLAFFAQETRPLCTDGETRESSFDREQPYDIVGECTYVRSLGHFSERIPAAVHTHMGEGDFALGRFLAAAINFLHEGSDHQLSVIAWGMTTMDVVNRAIVETFRKFGRSGRKMFKSMQRRITIF